MIWLDTASILSWTQESARTCTHAMRLPICSEFQHNGEKSELNNAVRAHDHTFRSQQQSSLSNMKSKWIDSSRPNRLGVRTRLAWMNCILSKSPAYLSRTHGWWYAGVKFALNTLSQRNIFSWSPSCHSEIKHILFWNFAQTLQVHNDTHPRKHALKGIQVHENLIIR